MLPARQMGKTCNIHVLKPIKIWLYKHNKMSQLDELCQEYYFYYKSSSYQHEVKIIVQLTVKKKPTRKYKHASICINRNDTQSTTQHGISLSTGLCRAWFNNKK